MAMVSRTLSLRVETVEKYRDLACTLRARAGMPAHRSQRVEILALADYFDRLADQIRDSQSAPDLQRPQRHDVVVQALVA